MLKKVDDHDRIVDKKEELENYRAENKKTLFYIILSVFIIVWGCLVLTDNPIFNGHWQSAAHLFRRFLPVFVLLLILNTFGYIINRKKIKELSRDLGEGKTDDREEEK